MCSQNGWKFVIFVIILSFNAVLSVTENKTCTCDTITAITNGDDCVVQIINDYPAKLSGCNCLNAAYYAISEVNGVGAYTIVCYATTTTSTTTTTTLPPTTTEPPFVGACGVVKLTGDKNTYFKACFWLGGLWVVLWTLITLITNIACKSWGQHRFLYILQELAIIFCFVLLGYFTTDSFDSEMVCKGTTIALHFCIVFILGLCVMEAVFAKSIIGGNSAKNGSCNIFISILLPLLLACVTAGATYYFLKKYYALGMHCFITVSSDQFWPFVFPSWALLVLSVLIGQLGFLACKKSLKDVDKGQLFWAFKTCKSLPLFSIFFISCFFMAAFALDYQKIWLAGVFVACSLIFGPLIFVTHTFNFEPTATTLWKKTNIAFYRPCPPEEEKKPTPQPEPLLPPQDEMYPNPYYYPPPQQQQPYDPARPPQYYPPSYPPQQPDPQPPVRPDPTPTSSQPFYNWLTDRNPTNLNKTEDILFRPQPF